MAKLLLGKEVTAALNAKLQAKVDELKAKGIAPKLGIIRCGENPSDLSYEKGATARAELIGVEVQKFLLPEDVTKEALIDQIKAINADPSIHGVLMFRPLPKHLKADQDEICNALDPAKDVDCMTDLSNAGVFEGRKDLGFPPCTPQACMEILDYYGIDCKGKKAVVIGRSLVVGKPAAMMLMGKNATVTVCHTRTVDVPAEARQADILVSSAGV
ncbi:MAG: bifunctional 5,10-methylenetetrahydrofolate dehydrogenase/5,10-methenyltetrahydrofolate cyclohydrolase, partial [Clostridia bacterium]|nr:bifunctional 5,10-methylenetetrahydrofolate dehydrogenase/5,10-methenyltetrahydrofolate cyclohydrolase [Clostridia bacterium]